MVRQTADVPHKREEERSGFVKAFFKDTLVLNFYSVYQTNPAS
jgi:hypothetical protein